MWNRRKWEDYTTKQSRKTLNLEGFETASLKVNYTKFYEKKDILKSEELISLGGAFEFAAQHLNFEETMKDKKYDYLFFDRHKICLMAIAELYGVLELSNIKKVLDMVPDPDRIVYFDTPVDVALERIHKRANDKLVTRRETIEALNSFRINYERLLGEMDQDKIIWIDGSKDLGNMSEEVDQYVLQKIRRV